jgi:hypothetical protein
MDIYSTSKKTYCSIKNRLEWFLSKNDSIRKKPIYNILFASILLFIFLVILILNIKTPITGDDYVYSFVYLTQDRINSINDIFESQYIHYFKWGGRSIVHIIAQALLWIKEPIIIDIINSIAFLGLITCMQYHIKGKKKKSCSLLFITFTLVWLLQPAFAETTLWITGSSNYLWGTLLILLYLLPYRLYKNNKLPMSKTLIYALIMFAGGIIAGWTNENTAGAMIIVILLFILYYKSNKWQIPSWSYIGLLGTIIGYTLMIVAPGNFARAEGTGINPFLIIHRISTHTQTFVNYLGILNLGVAILTILYTQFTNESKKQISSLLIIYSIAVLVSIYIMIFSPGFPPRAWFGAIIFNIIIFGIILYNLNYNLIFIQKIKVCILLFCIIAFGFSFYDAYKDVNEIDKIWKSRMITLAQKKKEGAKSVTFKTYQVKTKFGLGDTPYALRYMSQYYDIDFQLEQK